MREEKQWNYDRRKCRCGEELEPEDNIFCEKCRETLKTIAKGGAGS